jgi:hypothetical protein
VNRGQLTLAALVLVGCNDPPVPNPATAARCDPTVLGLRSTRSGLDWLTKGVAGANALLAQEGQYQLQLMTESVAAMDTHIPVWPVAAAGLTPMETAFVPHDCRAIFIQTAALNQRVVSWNGDLSTGLTIEVAPIASWILLHETGHIHDASSGQIDPAPSVRGNSFSDTLQKRRELSADAFAARLIRSADARQPYATFIAGMNTRQALTQLSWNLQRDRQLGLLASSELATPKAFGDVGETHPNLELRVLITLVLVEPSDEAQALLDEFVATRSRAADPAPRVLYDASKP